MGYCTAINFRNEIKEVLPRVLKSARISDGLVKGLHECTKALDKREAHFCVYASDCDEPAYEKLVRALCKEHKIPIVEVDQKKVLGEWVGQCRYDVKGEPRKVVGCSCAVVKDYGRDDEAKRSLQDFLKTH